MRNARRISSFVFVAMLALLVSLLSQTMFATVFTSAHPVARVTKKIDNGKRSMLHGHLPAALRTAKDLGHLDANTQSDHMIMVLRSDEQQKREIRRVIDEQQDKRTVNYHQWATPQEFGAHFGVHDDDIAQIKAWLASQGFTVDDVSQSKRVIHFSGTTGAIEKAFQTEMHTYVMGNGETHVSNNSEITVPEALSPVIAGVSLHNFFRKGHMGEVSRIKRGPKYTSSSSVHYVGPQDFATIYNTAPLLAAGINGTGSTIAIVGRSDILLSDVQSYRQLFNLPPNDPTFIHAGQDNGTEPGDDGESDLDVEISGGMAPNAHVDFVIGTPTFLVDGITNSIEYIVENNLADIMSISYGDCEANEGVGGNEFNNQAFEQAAAQGISVFIASGDNGPAECDDQNDSYEVLGYAAGGESSTPYSVSVGGTELSGECTTLGPACTQSNVAKYWATTTNGYYLSSALEYIPETPWNEGKGSNINADASSSLSGLWSDSGGISAYYLRPSWQQGANSSILVSQTDPALASYLAGSGGSLTTESGNWVASVTLTNGGGSGYTTAPSVTFTGGTCTNLPATASTTISGGSVTSVVFNYGTQGGTLANGQGLTCTVAPTVAFTAAPGGGTTATGTAVLGPMQIQQPLVTGVPHRLTPDVVLNAADGHDATLFCSEGVCEFTTSASGQNTISDAGLVGGTSVAAPSMAGIQALINQANGGRQGMPNYVYYALAAAENDTNCAASALVPPNDANLSNCVFQDIQVGNTYICGTSTCTSTSGTKIGWAAGPGYDLATGLGSVNAYNLATQWKNVVFNSTSTTLGLSQTTGISHGSAVTLSGAVSGAGTPTGDVAFIVSQGEIGVPVNLNTGAFVAPGAFATLSGGSYSANLSNLPGGTYNVWARYGGDGSNASSLSAPVQVTVSSEPSTISITPQVINLTACSMTNGNSFTYGQLIWVQVSVAGVSGQGVPTGSVNIGLDSNNSYATVTLDPNGNGYLVAGNVGTASNSCLYDYLFAQSPMVPGGAHTITASYSGDATFQASTAGTPASITVSPISTSPTLAAGGATIVSGAATSLAITFPTVTALTAASSTPGASGPTGTVTFTDTTTSTVLGTASVVPSVTYVGGSSSAFPSYTYAATALFSTTGITTVGANSITASYSGDSNYSAASVATPATVTVDSGSGVATTTTVTSSANPTTINGRPTFTATIGAGSGTAPTTGTVTFYDATYSLVLGTGAVGSAHTATFRPASGYPFVGGLHNIVATFGGVTGNTGSTSAAFAETVTKGAGAVVLSTKQVGTSGQTYTFAGVFTPSPSSTGFEPTLGVMTFYDAVNGGASTAITTAVPNEVYASQGGYGLWTASGSATLSTAGTHVITAQYNDVNYLSAVSNSVTVYVSNGSSGIYSPLPGSTLSNTGSTTYKWYPVAGTPGYWLDIGSTQGSHNYYSSGNVSTVLSLAVANNVLPTNGSSVWARLYYLVNGNWQYTDSSFTSYGSSSTAVMTSPAPGSILSGSSQAFSWSAAAGASGYWIDAGSTAGAHDIYSSGNLGNVLTTTVSGLPTNGSTVYITLYTLQNGNWLSNGYTYTAFSLAAAAGVMTAPTPGSVLTGSSVTFDWTAGSGASAYWIDIGSTAGGHDIYSSGSLGNVLTTTVNGLPTDGSTIYVTLYSQIGGTWSGNAYTYTALNATSGLATMQTPTNNSTLSGNAVTFTWSSDSNATGYWVDVSTVGPGGNDLDSSGNLGTALTETIYNLPANGSTIYVTLYSYVGGQWLSNAYTYVSGP